MPKQTIVGVATAYVTAELSRHGIDPDERVTLGSEPVLFPGRHELRKLVVAAGLSDDDIDRPIAPARDEVAPHPR